MKIHVTLSLSERDRIFELEGRLGWAMAQLVDAGPRGLTTIGQPSFLFATYVHHLRQQGFPIETQMEAQGGLHARYGLSCDAEVRVLV